MKNELLHKKIFFSSQIASTVGSIWEKLNRGSLEDSCGFCLYSIHPLSFENNALILYWEKIPPPMLV